MNLVEIRVINVEIPLWAKDLERFCLQILDFLDESGLNISLVLCDDDFIRDLNKRYRGIDKVTDVLSFPQESDHETDGMRLAGDIIISVPMIAQNAQMVDIESDQELKRLAVHGILHLLGMDHDEDAFSGEMLDLQEDILQKFVGERLF